MYCLMGLSSIYSYSVKCIMDLIMFPLKNMQQFVQCKTECTGHMSVVTLDTIEDKYLGHIIYLLKFVLFCFSLLACRLPKLPLFIS